jgi:hypothetical protein
MQWQKNTERIRLPPLRKTKKGELNAILKDANVVAESIPTKTLKETNGLMYSTALILTSELGYDTGSTKAKDQKEPKWKVRLQKKLAKLRADLSNLKKWQDHKLKSDKVRERLRKTYKFENKDIVTKVEELKQRVMATANKIRRYESRISQYKQNQLFKLNQRAF